MKTNRRKVQKMEQTDAKYKMSTLRPTDENPRERTIRFVKGVETKEWYFRAESSGDHFGLDELKEIVKCFEKLDQ